MIVKAMPTNGLGDGGFLAFALSGGSRICQQIAKFNQKCPYVNNHFKLVWNKYWS